MLRNVVDVKFLNVFFILGIETQDLFCYLCTLNQQFPVAKLIKMFYRNTHDKRGNVNNMKIFFCYIERYSV